MLILLGYNIKLYLPSRLLETKPRDESSPQIAK